jgi:hypothetical protein
MLVGMTREESDREDLLGEATALEERIELAPIAGAPGSSRKFEAATHPSQSGETSGSADNPALPGNEPIVVGFRACGAASFFFGDDPVYQFNTAAQLRRAYSEGLLFKAVRGRLVSLERVRKPTEVQLLRRELPPDKTSAFLAEMHNRLHDLAEQLEAGRLKVIGQVPAGTDVLGRVQAWLTDHTDLPIAVTPHVRAATRERCG